MSYRGDNNYPLLPGNCRIEMIGYEYQSSEFQSLKIVGEKIIPSPYSFVESSHLSCVLSNHISISFSKSFSGNVYIF
jgi:hypothetical protein